MGAQMRIANIAVPVDETAQGMTMSAAHNTHVLIAKQAVCGIPMRCCTQLFQSEPELGSANMTRSCLSCSREGDGSARDQSPIEKLYTSCPPSTTVTHKLMSHMFMGSSLGTGEVV